MANPIIKIKRGSTAPVATLQAGEFAIDQSAKNLYLGVEVGGVVTNEIVGGEGTFATKAYTDAAVASLGSSGGAALTQEIADRTAADTALDGKITVEKNRIDAILSAADADKDSFAEIVSLINSVDTENDSAFAGYVTSNNAAHSALAARVSALETTIDGGSY